MVHLCLYIYTHTPIEYINTHTPEHEYIDAIPNLIIHI